MALCQEWEAVGWSLWEDLIPLLLRDAWSHHESHPTPTEHPKIRVGHSAPNSAPAVQLCVTRHGSAVSWSALCDRNLRQTRLQGEDPAPAPGRCDVLWAEAIPKLSVPAEAAPDLLPMSHQMFFYHSPQCTWRSAEFCVCKAKPWLEVRETQRLESEVQTHQRWKGYGKG